MTMTKTLFILNDAPYGMERSYNALRGAERSSLEQLAEWTVWADKTLVL